MREADFTHNTRVKAIPDFLQKVLPELASFPLTETDAKKKKNKQPPPPPLPSQHFEVGTETEPVAISSTSAVYETLKPRFTIGEIRVDNDDDVDGGDDEFVKGDTGRTVGRMSAL